MEAHGKAGHGSIVALVEAAESRLVVMNWRGGEDEAPLAFVGKGVTFDTGGIFETGQRHGRYEVGYGWCSCGNWRNGRIAGRKVNKMLLG